MNIVLKARQVFGMTQEEFGEHIGKARETINKYERGKYKIPKSVCFACKRIIERRER
jgi:DNA-binding XRE family transcriptional regulator